MLKVTEVIQGSPESSVKQLHLVKAFIYQEMGQIDKYNSEMTVYLKHSK